LSCAEIADRAATPTAQLVLAARRAGRLQRRHRLHQGLLRNGLHSDLGEFDVPTLILHGDDDQIVPIGASAMLSSTLVKNARLEIYKGLPHGMCSTHKDRINADLLSIIKS
jgi:pimeloyl-ACP methyl ester carboxylesterase